MTAKYFANEESKAPFEIWKSLLRFMTQYLVRLIRPLCCVAASIFRAIVLPRHTQRWQDKQGQGGGRDQAANDHCGLWLLHFSFCGRGKGHRDKPQKLGPFLVLILANLFYQVMAKQQRLGCVEAFYHGAGRGKGMIEPCFYSIYKAHTHSEYTGTRTCRSALRRPRVVSSMVFKTFAV